MLNRIILLLVVNGIFGTARIWLPLPMQPLKIGFTLAEMMTQKEKC